MKKILMTLFLMYLFAHVIGQNWAPIGAKWTYGRDNIWLYTIQYCDWVSTCDTFVGGHNCRLIKRNGYGYSASSDISDKLITYEDSNRIYLYNTVLNQFTVLYDFNKNAGDTWTMTLDTCDLLITVDSTGMDTINGFPLKSLYISSPNWAFNGKILQHIGHLTAPNPDINYHCYHILYDGTFYTGLRCYEDSLLGFHDFGIAPNCYFTTSINEVSQNSNQIKVYPNPFSMQTTLRTDNSFKDATLTIYNLYGQQLNQIKNISGQSIILHRDNLPSGMYYLRLTQDNIVISTDKFVIID